MASDELMVNREAKKMYWKCIEVCSLLSIPKKTLRDWIHKFNIKPSHQTGINRKIFLLSMEQVALLHHIYRLVRIEKYTIEGAKIQLRKAKLI